MPIRSINLTNRGRGAGGGKRRPNWVDHLGGRIFGQPGAIDKIAPYIKMYQAGLAPDNRPAGVFLLLGPTGTGKTRTVEAIAELLHGSEKSLLRIDCGEFQMEHEVAKLIGAPPGYLGHRETQPLLTQQKLASVTSEHSNLSLILFDEIEKAAPSMTRLLLGLLDKGQVRLGDNNTVSFERSLVFFTSNLGARAMEKVLRPSFGFEGATGGETGVKAQDRIERIAMNAVRKRFPPEFVNRLDAVVTYHSLEREALLSILDNQLLQLQQHIDRRLGLRAFELLVSSGAKRLLLRLGTSPEYGARELKRVILRLITQPVAAMVADREVLPGQRIHVELAPGGETLRLTPRRLQDRDEDDEAA